MQIEERVQHERALRRAVLAGDDAAWRTWYAQCFERLHAYVCWRCGGKPDLADDIVQETWLTAVRRIRAFDPDRGSFLSWLRGIAANVLRNQLRAPRLHRTLSLHVAPAVTLPPTDQVEQTEGIMLALSDLSERQESVLRAKYLDGQSVGQIAAEWNETPKAIESLLTRARAALREAHASRESNHAPTPR